MTFQSTQVLKRTLCAQNSTHVSTYTQMYNLSYHDSGFEAPAPTRQGRPVSTPVSLKLIRDARASRANDSGLAPLALCRQLRDMSRNLCCTLTVRPVDFGVVGNPGTCAEQTPCVACRKERLRSVMMERWGLPYAL